MGERNAASLNKKSSSVKSDSQPSELLTVADVANLTNYSKEHIRRLIRNGKLPAKLLTDSGRKYIIERRWLDEVFVNSCVCDGNIAAQTADQKIPMYAREIAAQAPPLSQDRKDRLRELLS